MRTVFIFMNEASQAVEIPKDMQFEAVAELEIRREGDTVLLRPVRPNWVSFAHEPTASADFLAERPCVLKTDYFDLSGAGESSEEPGQ
ncbi:type II toxin-antitoxin system VapB family antitoxin [Caballeronia sordidicola]|jgi:antitoxin VapB|uniref:Virulence-associated protein vagC n=1 Tax=Caballeronia sordidicola TaxID=196367 RepID=A0A226X4G8_CABSO|nr:type II toxin-antitoxin system VapB family antitoxin [Caballeronia sordidicola]OXC77890.1 Virulence-associated protein vagC [Caballeronia sordidicola]